MSTDYVEYTDSRYLESGIYEENLSALLLCNGGEFPPGAPLSPTTAARLAEIRKSSQVFAEIFPRNAKVTAFDPPVTLADLWLCRCDTYNYREADRCSHCNGAQSK